MTSLVQIRVLGGLQVEVADPPRTITRFRSKNIAALLAFLALSPGKMYTREELADLLWPDVAADAGRNNLRVALSSLRRQLEPPSAVPAGTVLVAQGRERVGLSRATTRSDAAEFEDLIRQSRQADAKSAEQQILALETAVQVYRGPLLPGFYEEWISLRRSHLSDAFQNSLSRLALLYQMVGDVEREAEYTQRAASVNSSDASWHGILPDPPARNAHGPEVTSAAPSKQAINGAQSNPSSRDDDPVSSKTNNSAAASPIVPVFMTRFFGRETEVDEIAALLQPRAANGTTFFAERLVTLAGPGGMGKTRLAVHVAERIAPLFPGGVFWVALTNVPNASQIADAILHAVTVATNRARHFAVDEPLDAAVALLSGPSPSLLVLDNFEHLVEEGTSVIEQVLARTPNVFCLVTSRQRLLLGIEREVTGLPVPPTGQSNWATQQIVTPVLPEQLTLFAGVQVFVDRAQSARPDFQVTARNAAAVATLCARLDGLPLALELAAGWSLTLTPEQILARLEQPQTTILTARRRDIVPRHRSLEAVLEDSYRLLPAPLRQLFARLSVFRGTWTADAAQAVCCVLDADAELAPPNLLAGVDQLRERSLLVAEEREGNIRLRMLSTVRTFAEARLDAKEREEIETRHTHYFVGQAEEAEPHVRGGPQQTHWIKALEADHDNLRAVLIRAGTEPQKGSAVSLRLAGALGWFWVVRSHWREGFGHCQKALKEDDGTPSVARAKALYAAGGLAWTLNRYSECISFCHESLEVCRLIGDRWGSAFSLALLGTIAVQKGDYTNAQALLSESLTAFRALSDVWGTAFALDNLAHVCRDQKDYDCAAALYAQSLELRRTIEDQQGEAMSLSNLADTAQLQGDWPRAAVLHEASLERFRQLGDKAGIGYGLRRLGECALEQGDMGRAEDLNGQSMKLFWELGDMRRLVECLEKTAILRQEQGKDHVAIHLLGAANALRVSLGIPLPASERSRVDASITRLKDRISRAGFRRLWSQGEIMEIKELIAY